MANEIKAEFEQYVKQLTETICKEIYLEDLKNLCKEYMEQLDSTKELYIEHKNVEQDLREQSEKSIDEISSLHKVLEDRVEQLQGQIQSFHTGCDQLLQEYSAQVQNINSKMREDFVGSFTETMEAYKEQLSDEMDQCNENIKESLKETITHENLQEYIRQVEASSAKVSEGLDMLNSGYTDIFKQYQAQVFSYGEEERERFKRIVQTNVQQGIDTFLSSLNQTIDRQKAMIEERVADKHMVEAMSQEVEKLRQDVLEVKDIYEKKLERLIKVMEKEEKIQLRLELGRRKDHRLILALLVGNISVLYFSLISIVLLQPWKVLGVIPAVLLGVIFVAGIAGAYVWWKQRRKKALKSGAKRESKVDNNGAENTK